MAPIHAKALSAGLILIELLFTLLLLALLLNLSAPELHELYQHKRSDKAAKRVERLIELARISAITDNSIVTICKSFDGLACNGRWEDGVLVFVDHNGDRKVGNQDRIVRYLMFTDFDGTLWWRAFQNRQYLQITSQGFTRYQNGNFTFCPASGELRFARQLVITRTGRVRHALDNNGDGIREDSRGKPLRCA